MKKKSDENNELDLPELPAVDYSKLPKEIEEAIAKGQYTIDKKVKLTWDGRQFIIRIPSEIAREMNLTSENQIRFLFKKPLPGSDEKPSVSMELI